MRRSRLLCLVVASLVVLAAGSNAPAAQSQRSAPGTGPASRAGAQAAVDDDKVSRGRYIVEDLVVCSRCHSPVDSTGARDRSRWLLGGQIGVQPTVPVAEGDWTIVAPRLAGAPPGTDDQILQLLTTGISRTGGYLRQPMPQFRMTRSDAEAVLAYLKSLGSSGHTTPSAAGR